MKFWLCGFSMRKKWKSNVIIQFSHKVIYNSCIQSIREKDQWKKNKRMASIYIKNYMKGKRLLVAKNAKVNKKILWSGYTGTNSSLWIPKKNTTLSLLFLSFQCFVLVRKYLHLAHNVKYVKEIQWKLSYLCFLDTLLPF